MSTDSKYPKIETNALGYGAFLKGDDEKLVKILELFPIDALYYPIQESIEYLKFLNRTIAGFQKYSFHLQSISEDCDVLVIDRNGVKWASPPKWL